MILKLKQHFNAATYDKKYQDIECLGFNGYSGSSRSWLNIKDKIEWKDKIICDLGCFHVYFSIKVIQSGAKSVIALDRSPTVLETAKMIVEVSDVKGIEFKEWTGGESIPNCDIILCLNVLHHFDDIPLALSMMNARTLFEINNSDLEKVLNYFNILQTIPSHRQNRGIYFCERK